VLNINKVFIAGEITRPIIYKTTVQEVGIATTTIKTNETWIDKKTGLERVKYEWHKIVFWGQLALTAYNTLKVGDCVSLEGVLRTRKWTNEADGTTKYFTEIHINSIKEHVSRVASMSGSTSRLTISSVEY